LEVSSDGGQTFTSLTVDNVQTRATARHMEDTLDSRFFDAELLLLQPPTAGTAVRLRESPSRPSLGKTRVQAVGTPPTYRIGSFFDVFTEISLDGGATWSPVVDPTHLELRP